MYQKEHPEFPSDIFISFEALDVKVVAMKGIDDEKEMTLEEFLGDTDRKMLLKAFILPRYPKDMYIYDSFKVILFGKS